MSFPKLYFVLIGFMICSLGVIYYLFDPAKYSFFPRCPFYVLTNLQCPGCGSQRAVFCLFHGELMRAVHYNGLLVASLPFLAIHYGYKLVSVIKKEDIRWKLIYHPLTPKLIFATVAIFWAARIYYGISN